MAAPLAGGAVEIALTDELISAPYVALTYGLMAQFGVKVENEGPNQRFKISSGQTYQSPGTVFVEGDASSASYFLAAGAITGGPVTVVGCGSASVQGDVAFANVLEQMGATVEWGERGQRLTYGLVCVALVLAPRRLEPPLDSLLFWLSACCACFLSFFSFLPAYSFSPAPNSITVSRNVDGSQPLVGVDVDCGMIPDAAMTLAPVALFCQGPTTIRNVYSWRVKETERMVRETKDSR
jgi:3-phosphoshikimate 1-carboxyvinyltransferase